MSTALLGVAPFVTHTHCLQEGLVSLEALMGHLEPSDDDLKVMQAAGDESLKKAIAQIGIVNLTKASEVMPKQSPQQSTRNSTNLAERQRF